VVSPGDLIRDSRTTPFNLGQRVELTDFTRDEAVVFAQGLRRKPEIASSLLDRIFYWTNGHPYLTQQLCKEIASDAEINDRSGVDRKCNELFFSVRAKERESNLIFVQDQLLRGETDRAGLLDLYSKVRRGRRVLDDETKPLMTSMRLSGITRLDRNRLRIRNRIYERVFDLAWIKTNLPDAEARRQREAYRRGLIRAATLALVIVSIMAALLGYAFSQRNRASQINRNLENALQDVKKEKSRAEDERNHALEQENIAEAKRKRPSEKELLPTTRS